MNLNKTTKDTIRISGYVYTFVDMFASPHHILLHVPVFNDSIISINIGPSCQNVNVLKRFYCIMIEGKTCASWKGFLCNMNKCWLNSLIMNGIIICLYKILQEHKIQKKMHMEWNNYLLTVTSVRSCMQDNNCIVPSALPDKYWGIQRFPFQNQMKHQPEAKPGLQLLQYQSCCLCHCCIPLVLCASSCLEVTYITIWQNK